MDDITHRTVCTAEDKAGTLTTRTNNTEIPLPVPLSISYPIPPSSTRVGTFKHPYFAFRIPAPDAGSIAVEWQIHPIQQGRMRYTLVRCPAQQQQDDILAVYYHIGVEASLSLPYSEGVLLVPGSQGSAGDSGAIVVASALGMLWRLRELHGTDGKSGKRNEKKPPRLGSIKGLFGRKE